MLASVVIVESKLARPFCPPSLPPFYPFRPLLRSIFPCLFSIFRFVLCSLAALSFQQLPTINFCNSLVLITIRIAGGGYTPSPSHALLTPFSPSLFSSTYALPNLQALCFDNVATVGGGWGVPNFGFRVSNSMSPEIPTAPLPNFPTCKPCAPATIGTCP